MGPFAVATAFWLFLAVVSVAGIISDYYKRRLALEPLRTAIERGQQLDPALIERLLARDRRSEEINPQHLQIGGILTIAGGIGFAVLSLFLRPVAWQAFYPVLGFGLAAVCVGVGLLITAKVLTRGARAADTS